jgi:hypothetical protein
MAAVEPKPLILTNASLKISTDGTSANLQELACVTNHIELSPDVNTTTLDTMCGSKDYPGTVKWALIATLYQSFDVDATEDTLSAAVESGAPVAYEVMGYRDQPVSASNPVWSGLAIPQPYSPINGDAGDASEIDLEWSLVGEPTKSITPGALTAAQKAAEKDAKEAVAA